MEASHCSPTRVSGRIVWQAMGVGGGFEIANGSGVVWPLAWRREKHLTWASPATLDRVFCGALAGAEAALKVGDTFTGMSTSGTAASDTTAPAFPIASTTREASASSRATRAGSGCSGCSSASAASAADCNANAALCRPCAATYPLAPLSE